MLRLMRVGDKYVGLCHDEQNGVSFQTEAPLAKDDLSKVLFDFGLDLRDIYAAFSELDGKVPDKIVEVISAENEKMKFLNPELYSMVKNWLDNFR